MMNTQIQEIANVWPNIQSIFSVPHTEKDHNNLVNLLDSLIDEVGNNESHPSGKRQINVRHLKLLSERFKVSPAVFV